MKQKKSRRPFFRRAGFREIYSTLKIYSTRTRQLFVASAGTTIACLSAGCHSHIVNTTIVNRGPQVHVVELDYPSASFGMDNLASGASYHYQFKIQGSGPLTLSFEDGSGKNHTVQGPIVRQGQEGSLLVTITGQNSAVDWSTKLR